MYFLLYSYNDKNIIGQIKYEMLRTSTAIKKTHRTLNILGPNNENFRFIRIKIFQEIKSV